MDVRLLLVHSPLVGPGTWDLVAADLSGRGWEVGVPDLTATLAAGPPYCVRQAEAIARSTSGRPAILIGHSGAGPLLAAAAAVTGQVRGYLFADAGLPIPGQTWMEPCRRSWPHRYGKWLMTGAGCRPGHNGGVRKP